MDARHFLQYIIRPTLDYLDMGGMAAERLLLGTALAESELKWLHQTGGGPALSFYQIEPATARDVYDNYLSYRPSTRDQVEDLRPSALSIERALLNDMGYATAIARLVYRRRKEPLPLASDPRGMALYHKRFYNTYLGAADPEITEAYFEWAINTAGT